MRRGSVAVRLLGSRGLASKAKSKGAKFDLGWDRLRAPLEATPMPLPNLASLTIVHGKRGHGQTGARKFKQLMPALRWQNPDVVIVQEWTERDSFDPPRVQLKFSDGAEQELEVMGQRSEQILGSVLAAVGASEDVVAQSMEWAAAHSATLDHRVAPSEEQVTDDDAEDMEDDDADEPPKVDENQQRPLA
uniref:Ribosomal protein/NADH dehydrogenase domain-containing protein n=1 Tax=Haptolina brevifila TaxID=156173 RepID=A0A7S2DLA5_9EUKA|mmetsp:Transcript_40444/g.81031  ORF Transcript_40444/g.81031 Transcript_40444/m.81031 type:complete len:190 (+) Transcript_40444:35-604(+)